MMVSPRLPGRLQTLQKHPRSERPRIEECMPGDALEAIMGYLDRETLCTARLVSKIFCAAASAHVCSLTLASTSEAVSFHRYPHPRHVTVRHAYSDTWNMEHIRLDPRLRDTATALTIGNRTDSLMHARECLSQAALMPKLRSLDDRYWLTGSGDANQEAASLARCTNLEAIRFGGCSISVAKTIVTLTRLTSLGIGVVSRDIGYERCADISWLGHATNLRSLQALRISMFTGALPLIGNLTGLTGLTLSSPLPHRDSIAPLSRLTRLRCLCIGWLMGGSNLGIACSLGSGSLVNLDLAPSEVASADCGRMLSRQTALTRLRLGGRPLDSLRHLGALRIELLQCLKIVDVGELDAEGLSVLWRATSLTRLCIGTYSEQPQLGFSQVLPRLTHLHSLSLRCRDATNFVFFPRAMSSLTKLKINSHALHDGDWRALLVLTGLRVLHLSNFRLADDVLPELGLLTNLHTLRVCSCGVTSLAPVREVLDPLREARGLPPLHTEYFA